MVSSNEEFYCTVQQIVKDLQAIGDARSAKALEDALSISTISGEVLGETRHELRKLRDENVELSKDQCSKLDAALNYVEKVLGPW